MAKTHQPYWAVRAHLLACLQRRGDAEQAYDRAIAFTDDEAVRAFLCTRRSELLADIGQS